MLRLTERSISPPVFLIRHRTRAAPDKGGLHATPYYPDKSRNLTDDSGTNVGFAALVNEAAAVRAPSGASFAKRWWVFNPR
jgi:hypothetical protein